MKKLYIILIALFMVSGARAQWSSSCLPEGITFTNQAQIDSFQVNYPGCVEIEGFVTISGDEITNLNRLNVLTSIGGSLQIDGNEFNSRSRYARKSCIVGLFLFSGMSMR